MKSIYEQNFQIDDSCVDRFDRMKPSAILLLVQEAAGHHCDLLRLDYDTMSQHQLFWAISRHRVQITRLPLRGETIRLETWPLPTTRVAFPRSVVAYDADGNECFRSISLWVLMDCNTRNMILPGKSGIVLSGTVRGTELAVPSSLVPAKSRNLGRRTVSFTDLDRNGHMNNTRCMDWISDLLPSAFHHDHPVKEFTICYLSEAREGQSLELHWDFLRENVAQVDAYRHNPETQKDQRVFSVQIQFD